MAQVESKLCCNCHHYRLGHLNDPCEQGNKKCGYLHEGCGKWKKAGESRDSKRDQVCSASSEIWQNEKEMDRAGGFDLERDVSISHHQND